MSLNEQQLLEIKPDHIVDAIGEVCPHTLNLALAGLKKPSLVKLSLKLPIIRLQPKPFQQR